jgi:hypothetical protein
VSEVVVILGPGARFEALDANAARAGLSRTATQPRLHERAQAAQWTAPGASALYVEDHLRGVRYLQGDPDALARVLDGVDTVSRAALLARAAGDELPARLAALHGLCALDGRCPGDDLAAHLDALSQHPLLAARRAALRMLSLGTGRALRGVIERAAEREEDVVLRGHWASLRRGLDGEHGDA